MFCGQDVEAFAKSFPSADATVHPPSALPGDPAASQGPEERTVNKFVGFLARGLERSVCFQENLCELWGRSGSEL